jgi:hypothetical protein
MAAPVPAASERQPTYCFEMMKRLGIEAGGGVVPRLSLSYATAFRRCKACQSKRPCHAWLDSMPASKVFAPRFCPNADIFFELHLNQPAPHMTQSAGAARMVPLEQTLLVLNCPNCGRSGEATISENVSPAPGHSDFAVHTISPAFKVIKGSIHWHRIMFRCTCDEVFSVIRRPKSAT